MDEALTSSLFESHRIFIMLTAFALKIYIRILGFFVSICRAIVRTFLWAIYSGKKKTVPPVKNPLLLKSATILASEIREGKVKCEDVIRAYCTRIEEVNPYINAICEKRFEAAIEEAQKVDELIASTSSSIQILKEEFPLLGVPFTTKLLISVKGLACNGGSLLHKDAKSLEDGDVVALMKKAGAICLATTNCPEFGLNIETYNKIYGRTSNPYDTTRTVGGSSGGEGALIGAGASLIGVANDLGGSIRFPGHFNGVFGHKPTIGLTSNRGVFPRIANETLNEMLSTGPMCRYAEDLALATKVMSGKNSGNIKFDTPVDFSKTNLYYFAKNDGNPLSMKLSPEIKDIITEAASHFQEIHGTNIQEIDFKELNLALFAFLNLVLFTVENKTQRLFTAGKYQLRPILELIKFLLGKSQLSIFAVSALNMNKLFMLFIYYNRSFVLRYMHNIQNRLEKMLRGNSVLILPSFPAAAYYHHELIPFLLPNISYVLLFNVIGYPVTQCPIRLNTENLPLGFQIVSYKGQDHLTIACAVELQKRFGGWQEPPLDEQKFPLENGVSTNPLYINGK